jgi:hypothetical protein
MGIINGHQASPFQVERMLGVGMHHHISAGSALFCNVGGSLRTAVQISDYRFGNVAICAQQAQFYGRSFIVHCSSCRLSRVSGLTARITSHISSVPVDRDLRSAPFFPGRNKLEPCHRSITSAYPH